MRMIKKYEVIASMHMVVGAIGTLLEYVQAAKKEERLWSIELKLMAAEVGVANLRNDWRIHHA